MATTSNKTNQSLVLAGRPQGHTVIPLGTLLTRLHYYDGKFLRATDLQAEQTHLRQLTALSNQAGGPGVVHGFDCTLADGDLLNVGAGQAIDPAGRVLLLPNGTSVGISELIEKSSGIDSGTGAAANDGSAAFGDCEFRDEIPPGDVQQASQFYLITLSHAEAYCGEEEVYGKLCESACLTSTDRPFIIEGVVVRAVPWPLPLPLPTSQSENLTIQHLRSRAASVFFAWEAAQNRHRIFGGDAGLSSPTWCLGARIPFGRSDVPIGLLARAGATTLFLDAWTARRERIEPPPQRYWAWQMAMRPWDVFLAHVLQFQCQLRDSFPSGPPEPDDDPPCADAFGLIGIASQELQQAAATIADLVAGLPAGVPPVDLGDQQQRLANVQLTLNQATDAFFNGPNDRMLIRRGIVELPSAGYLPVIPASPVSVEQQVRRWMGPGVDLRFCSVRADYVPHALEEAQHMERISLLTGLDDPSTKPEVDILVPDGTSQQAAATGVYFDVSLSAFSIPTEGAGRREDLDTGGWNFYYAVSATGPASVSNDSPTMGGLPLFGNFTPPTSSVPGLPGMWLSIHSEKDPFALAVGESTPWSVDRASFNGLGADRSVADGTLTIAGVTGTADHLTVQATIVGTQTDTSFLTPPGTVETPLNLPVVLVRRREMGRTFIDLSAGGVQFTLSWTENPTQAEAQLAVVITGAAVILQMIATATFTENADVWRTDNVNHDRAATLLEAVGNVFDDPTFLPTRLALLFPPEQPDEQELQSNRDWVLFHRRRGNSCSGGPLAETGLARIVATSWTHGGSENSLLTIHDAAGAVLGTGFVIGFDAPVSVIDPTGPHATHDHVLDVTIRQDAGTAGLAAALNPSTGVNFTLVEILSVLEPVVRCGLCVKGTTVPVDYQTAPGSPERIVQATRAVYPARGVAFIVDPNDPATAIYSQGDRDFTVRLRCDFVMDQTNRAADGEFVLGRFPTGDGRQGGLFESWVRLGTPPIIETVCNEVYVLNYALGQLDQTLQVIPTRLGTLVNSQSSLGSVDFGLTDNIAVPASLAAVTAAWNQRFPAGVPGPDNFVAVTRVGATTDEQTRQIAQSQQILNAVLASDLIHVVNSETAGFPSQCPAVTLALVPVTG